MYTYANFIRDMLILSASAMMAGWGAYYYSTNQDQGNGASGYWE